MSIEMKQFLEDIAKRAAHTFWQTFSAAVVVLWASSGIGADNLTDVASWEKLGLGIAAAALASLFSTIKSLGIGIQDAKYQERVDAQALEPEDEEALRLLKDDPEAELPGQHAEK